jgi:SAM-dependent methyltransferase
MALLEEPALKGVDLGSTRWFDIQRELIVRRPLVKATYDRWYSLMLADAGSAPPAPGGQVVELGSGANYVKLLDPTVITSDVVPGSADMVVDAQALPFADATLRAILLTHVFHHIPQPERFLEEALRALVPGGVITMIDVAHTPFARLLFGRFHPEKYESRTEGWALDTSGPYGGANQAMTWIVFRRDAGEFARRFPGLRIECIELLPWFGYLLSGGLTRRNLIPPAVVSGIRLLDRATTALNSAFALHWHIRIRKVAGIDG